MLLCRGTKCGLWVLTIGVVCSINMALFGQIINAEVEQKSVRVGDQVSIKVDGLGKIGVESDIAMKSFEHDLSSSTSIRVGVIRSPGLYSVRLLDGKSKPFVIGVAVLRDSSTAQSLIIESKAGQPSQASPLSAVVMKKFWEGVNQDRLKRAIPSAFKVWSGTNAVALSNSLVTCTVCVVPGGQVACPVCLETGGANTAALALEISKKLAEIEKMDGVLSAAEADRLIRILDFGQALGSIASSSNKLELGVSAAVAAVDLSIDNYVVKAVVANAKDEVSKTYLLISILKKVN